MSHHHPAPAGPAAGQDSAAHGKTWSRLLGDIGGALVASLISIPQAMGLGLLAFAALGPAWGAAGVVAAILSSVIGSLVAGLIPAGNCLMMGARTSASVVMAGILGLLVTHPQLQTPQGPDTAQVLTLAFVTLFLSGLFQLGFGLLRLGRFVKFVPYPVIAGFMNGIAILMLMSQIPAALGMEAGRPMRTLFDGSSTVLPGSTFVVLGVLAAIVLAPRLSRRLPVLVVGLVAGIALHYLIAVFAPQATGPLVGTLPVGDFAPSELVAMANFSLRDDVSLWLAFLLPSAALLATVSALDGLLAALVTDPATHGRHNGNRLLTGQGAAAAVAAAFGALPPLTSTHTRIASHLAGGRTPRCAMFHAAFMLFCLLALAPLIAMVPVAALAGVIIYTAWSLVDRWTRDLVRRLGSDHVDRREIMLNLGVVVVVAMSLVLLNIMAAFAIGITAAVMLLLVRISRSPVRRVLDGSVRSSLKIRGPEARAALVPLARQIRIFELEGVIFFGTADRLQADVDAIDHGARYLILDFRRVIDIDASGARALETVGQAASRRNLRVLLSHVVPDSAYGRHLRAMGVSGIIPETQWFPDLDRALEWAEDRLLARARFEDAPELDPKDMALFAGLDDAGRSAVIAKLQRLELGHGDPVFREGDPGDRLYLIARGAVSIKLQIDGESRARRLATFVPGVFFGEMAMIERQPRSADAFAKGDRVVLYVLAAADIEQIVQDNPQLGIALYRNLSREIAQRLRITSGALRALE